MYGTQPDMWISVAEMHFEGAASCWFQSIESQLDNVTWEQFCAMISERFDRHQHEVLLRKLHTICQITSVTKYVVEFITLVEQLTSYAVAVDPIYFITRFVGGLKPEIRAVLIVHSPKTLDSAVSLALLQEEALEEKPANKAATQAHFKTAMKPLLTANSSNQDKSSSLNAYRATSSAPEADSKLAALKQYRCAMGLCYKCVACCARSVGGPF
jgi:hypothetical protein